MNAKSIVLCMLALAMIVPAVGAETVAVADKYVVVDDAGASVWTEDNGLDGLQQTETILPGDDGILGTDDDVTIPADTREL